MGNPYFFGRGRPPPAKMLLAMRSMVARLRRGMELYFQQLCLEHDHQCGPSRPLRAGLRVPLRLWPAREAARRVCFKRCLRYRGGMGTQFIPSPTTECAVAMSCLWQMSHRPRWDRGHPLHHPRIRAHFSSWRDSTACRCGTHAGAGKTLEPSGPSIHHTKPPHTCPALTLHHAWPNLSRDRLWLLKVSTRRKKLL